MHVLKPLSSILLSIILCTFAAPSFAHDDDVPAHRHPRLKRRIVKLEAALAELRADTRAAITLLRSEVDYQGREDAGGASGWPGGPGGMCEDPCATDSDGDGTGDCEDICPCDASTTDGDGDGTTDCLDPCPDDATDACIDPCRNDFDADGVLDCEDPCPWDPAGGGDRDGDGIVDCQDGCPDDPNDECYDWCRLDQDGDGVADCKDPCPWAGEPDNGGGVIADCAMPAAMRARAR
jgi:hypothetical protein